MAIPEEQVTEIKKQLIEQINSTFPEDKKQSSISQIESMNKEELEDFLKQNNLIKQGGEGQQCIFCSIVSGQAQSYKVAETSDAIAILEINPISKGHVIVLPKSHTNQISESVEKFAREMQEKLREALNPNDVLIEHDTLFGHSLINVIPTYGEELKEKQQANPEELKELQQKISSQKIEKKEEKPIVEEGSKLEQIDAKTNWIPKRIP